MGAFNRSPIAPEEFRAMGGAEFIGLLNATQGGPEYLRTFSSSEIAQIGREFESANATFGNDGKKIMQWFVDNRRMDPSLGERMQSHPSGLDEAKMAVINRIEDWSAEVSKNVATAQAELRGSPDGGARRRQLDNAERQAVGGPSM